jgi:hypothetical protein
VPPRGYSNITVRSEVREELERLREELKVRDFSDLLVFLVRSYKEYTRVASKVEELLTSVSSKVDELLTRVASSSAANPTTSSSSSSAPSLTSVSSSSAPSIGGDTGASTAEGAAEGTADSHIWCRKKSEVRNFKGFLEWVDHSFELLDWWEEGDKYCFETKRSPKERGRRGGGG